MYIFKFIDNMMRTFFNALFINLFLWTKNQLKYEQKSITTQETSTENLVEEYVVNEEEFDDNAPLTHEHNISFTNCNYFCATFTTLYCIMNHVIYKWLIIGILIYLWCIVIKEFLPATSSSLHDIDTVEVDLNKESYFTDANQEQRRSKSKYFTQIKCVEL